MKVKREGNLFTLRLNLFELLTLYCSVVEGNRTISASSNPCDFSEPEKVRKVMDKLQSGLKELIDSRTAEEKKLKFFGESGERR